MDDTYPARSESGGNGLFVRRSFRRGETVSKFRFVREITSESDLDDDPNASAEHCTRIDGKFYLVDSPERFLNHSCDPNVYQRFDGRRAELVAIKDISAGDELTTDYMINNEGGFSWPCSCGSDRCRGETGVSFFTLPLEFQNEYAAFLAPWFVRRNPEKLRHLESVPAV